MNRKHWLKEKELRTRIASLEAEVAELTQETYRLWSTIAKAGAKNAALKDVLKQVVEFACERMQVAHKYECDAGDMEGKPCICGVIDDFDAAIAKAKEYTDGTKDL